MIFALKIAWRYLLSSSITSLLVVLGSASGVALYIFMSSLLGAVSSDIVKSVIGSSSQVTIEAKDRLPIAIQSKEYFNLSDIQKTSKKESKLENWYSIIKIIESSKYIKYYCPTVTGSGFISKGNQINPITIRGIDSDKFKNILNLEDKLESGKYNLSAQNCLVGNELANDLGVKINTKLIIKSSKNIISSFTVSGIFNSGIKDINKKQIFMSIKDAQRLLGIVGYVTSIETKLNDVFKANEIADLLEKRTNLKISSWMRDNPSVISAIEGQSGSNSIIKVFTTISISLAITSILIVSAIQKSKEIGILKSMGTDTKTVMFIFIIQGLIIGFLGSVIGSLFAYLLIELVLYLPFNQPINGTRVIPIELKLEYFVQACSVITTVGGLASVIPARNISKLDPAEVMRNG